MEIKKKRQLILRPVLSEKSLNNYKKNKVCTFWVDPKATKAELKKEFEVIFAIKPLTVTTVISRENKNIRTTKRYSTARRYVKKAYLNIGENTLDIFENI